MFYEQIAEYTRAHIRSHIQTYLDLEETKHTDKLPLVFPKSIEPGTMLGGTMGIARETLPQYAIQMVVKSPERGFGDLFLYNYPGQVIAMVGGTNPVDVEKLAYRHAAALERMAKAHPHLHQYEASEFSLISWEWITTTFSGAMQLEREDSPVGELWVDAAQLTFNWVTSEEGMADQLG